MEIEKIKSIIEAILFAAGRQVSIKELMISLEMPKEDLENIIISMQEDYKAEKRDRKGKVVREVWIFYAAMSGTSLLVSDNIWGSALRNNADGNVFEAVKKKWIAAEGASGGLCPLDTHKPFCQTSWHYEFAAQIQQRKSNGLDLNFLDCLRSELSANAGVLTVFKAPQRALEKVGRSDRQVKSLCFFFA